MLDADVAAGIPIILQKRCVLPAVTLTKESENSTGLGRI